MYKHSFLYATLIAMRPVYRYAITASLLLTLGMTWFSRIYLPLHNDIKRMRQEIDDIGKQKRMMAMVQEEVNALQYSVTALQVTKNCKGAACAQDDIAFLVASAQQAGITLTSCSVENDKCKDWLRERSVTVDATGNWYKLVYFFEQLKNADRIVQCSHARLDVTQTSDYALRCSLDFCSVLPEVV